MEPRFGEFTEQPLTNKQANQCWLLALLLYLFICQIHYRKQLLLFLRKDVLTPNETGPPVAGG